jgi:hypothetical protein
MLVSVEREENKGEIELYAKRRKKQISGLFRVQSGKESYLLSRVSA